LGFIGANDGALEKHEVVRNVYVEQLKTLTKIVKVGVVSMNDWLRPLGIMVSVFGLAAGQAEGSVVVYSGTDVGAGPGAAAPNANAAAASFASGAATLGTATTITFASAPVGAFNNLAVAPGVSMNGTDYQGNPMYVASSPSYPSDPAINGFNTTPVGGNYVEMRGGLLTFTFAKPTNFFGAYFTGVQSMYFSDTITFTDSNGLQVVGISNPSSSAGGVTFVGFTDAGQSITSVTIDAGPPGNSLADFIGVDNVIFDPTPVPEPSTLAMAATAVAFGFARLLACRKLLVSVC
jgi:hypothetical protein